MKWMMALLAPVLVLGLIELAGCGKKEANTDTIKIGVFEPLTGANSAGGADETEGVRLANALYPEILGKRVELVVVDNKSDKVEAANAATLLVQKEKVCAVIGSWGSSLSMSGGPIFAEARVPAVGASCTNPNVTRGNDFYFRVCFIDPFQGTVMANYAFKNLNARRAAIIKEVSNDYSVGLAKYFVDAFTQLTGDAKAIVGEANYNTGDQDFTALLTNLKSLYPDVIFAPGNYTESALIIKQARQLGIATPFLGGDTWDVRAFLEVGGDAVEGTVLSTFFANDFPINKTSEVFLKEFRAKYGKEPAAVSALGFDAYLIILDAIKRVGSADPVKIRDAIAQTKDFEGAAGSITINEERNAVKDAVIKVVKGGKFAYLTTVKP